MPDEKAVSSRGTCRLGYLVYLGPPSARNSLMALCIVGRDEAKPSRFGIAPRCWVFSLR